MSINTIYVDEFSELGKLMEEMNNREEQDYISEANKAISNGTDKQQIIKSLKSFMDLFGNPPTRSFKLLKKYIADLEK